MDIQNILFAAALPAFLTIPALAGDRVTLTASSQPSGFADSAKVITLNDGDSASLLFAAPVSTGFYLVVSIAGKELAYGARVAGNGDTITNPIVIAGPAVVKARIGPSTPSLTGLMTLDVTRAGDATTSTPVPADAGAGWEVSLETSTDLINWTPASPGEFPASTTRRYFRTKLVRKAP